MQRPAPGCKAKTVGSDGSDPKELALSTTSSLYPGQPT